MQAHHSVWNIKEAQCSDTCSRANNRNWFKIWLESMTLVVCKMATATVVSVKLWVLFRIDVQSTIFLSKLLQLLHVAILSLHMTFLRQNTAEIFINKQTAPRRKGTEMYPVCIRQTGRGGEDILYSWISLEIKMPNEDRSDPPNLSEFQALA